MFTPIEVLEHQFTAGVACAVAAVNPVTLRAWRHRKLLDVGLVKDGWTKYSWVDLVAVTCMARLTQDGIKPEEAGKIALRCKVHAIGFLPNRPREEWVGWLVFSKSNDYTGWLVSEADDFRLLPRMEGRLKLTLEIGELVNFVFEQLEALNEEHPDRSPDD
jgi:hypothetical protein